MANQLINARGSIFIPRKPLGVRPTLDEDLAVRWRIDLSECPGALDAKSHDHEEREHERRAGTRLEE
jgi:hypothetical protein